MRQYYHDATDKGRAICCSGNLLIVRDTFRTSLGDSGIGARGEVSRFSNSSGRRMRRFLRTCVATYSTMVTLTYPGGFPTDGRLVKDHLRRFIQELRRYAERHDFCHSRWSTFWFLEFQERGAPHFHLFCTGEYPCSWVGETWYRIVGSEDERHLRAGSRIERLHQGRAGTISYASKYAAKSEQKIVPEEYLNVGRFWGISGCRDTVEASTHIPSRLADEFRPQTDKFFEVIRGFLGDGRAKQLASTYGFRVITLDHTVIEVVFCMVKMLSQDVQRKYGIEPAKVDLFQDADIDIDLTQ